MNQLQETRIQVDVPMMKMLTAPKELRAMIQSHTLDHFKGVYYLQVKPEHEAAVREMCGLTSK